MSDRPSAEHVSYWDATARPSSVGAPPDDREIEVDVAVIGAGITGVTTAYLLARSGLSVCVVDRGRVGQGDSGATTAHLTAITDAPLTELMDRFGRDAARAAWLAGERAIDAIERISRAEEIDASFRRVPAYVWTAREEDVSAIEREARAARSLGFPAELVPSSECPFGALAAYRLPDQGLVHPLRYIRALAERAHARGVVFLEDTSVTKVSGKGPFELVADRRGRIRAASVIEATHQPLAEHVLLQTKLVPYQSFAIALELEPGKVPELLAYDTCDPYHYLRVSRGPDGRDLAIFGGEDVPTGESVDRERPYAALERTLSAWIPGVERRVVARWSGEWLEPVDGLPYIGAVANGRYVATGFSGTGITFGTFAGHLLRDELLGPRDALAPIFSPTRKPIRSIAAYLKHNLSVPLAFVRDRLLARRRSPGVAARLTPGQGAVVSVGGQKVAVSRGADGRLQACSAVCTHMACLVSWNAAERTWDCPCHGSRFEASGAVHAGPATTPLAAVDLEELERKREAA